MSDLDRLEKLAREVNIWGEWAIWEDLKEGGFVHVGNLDGVIPEGEMATSEDVEPNSIAKCYTGEIAEFIAAANPSVALDLIARVKAAEAERDAATAAIERVRALAGQWNATPDYVQSDYDKGRVDQRHDMTEQLLAALDEAHVIDEAAKHPAAANCMFSWRSA